MTERERRTLRVTQAEARAKPAIAKTAPKTWVPDRGEVIWIHHSPATGKEIPDQHPMLVSSTRAFNERTGLVIGFPVTHAQTHEDNPFAISVQGIKGTAYILANQPKSFDWRARDGRPHPWGRGHMTQLEEALAILCQICGVEAGQLS